MKLRINKNYLYAGLFPVLIYFLICFLQGAFIFDNYTFAINDAHTQYVPFAYYFAEKILNLDFSTWITSAGMGMNAIPTFTYYCMSPLNLLYIIFHNVSPYIIFDIILLIRIVLTSIITTYVIINLYKEDKHTFVFGLMYTFSGYFMAFYFNSIWFDNIMLFPLIFYFLKKYLINNNKKDIVKYSITLFIIFISNFYIAYEICVFIVIIFLFSNFKNTKDFFRKGITILLHSLMSICSGCFFAVYTVVYLMKDGGSEQNTGYTFSILDYFKSFLFGKTWNIDNPCIYLYFSTFGLFLMILFLLNKNNDKKEKIKLGAYIIISFLFAAIPFLNFFIHGFDNPNFLYNRYSFIIIFLFVVFAYKQYLLRENIKKKEVIIALSIISSFSIIVFILNNLNWVTFSCDNFIILMNLILAVAIGYLIIKNKFKEIAIITIFELFFSFFFASSIITLNSNQLNNVFEKEDYNIITTQQNYWALYDIDSLYVFSSGINKNISRFMYPITLCSGNVYYPSSHTNAFFYSLFGVKNIYDMEDELPGKLYSKLEKNNVEYYEYKYPLSMGYVIKNDISNLNFFENRTNLIDDTNMLFKLITNSEQNYLSGVKFETKDTEKNYKGYNEKIIFKEDAKNVYVVLDSMSSEVYFFENVKENDEYIITSQVGKINSTYAYCCKEDVLENEIIKIKQNELKNIEKSNNIISGDITLSEESYMLFRLTYDKNWHAYIDGKETDIISVDDALIELKVPQGHHNIELKYIDDIGAFKYLLYFNIISLLFMICYSSYVLIKKDNKKADA